MALQSLFHCPNCNAALDLVGNNAAIVRCEYCHSMVIVPESLRREAVEGVSEQVKVGIPSRPAKPKLSQAEAVARVTELVGEGELVEAMQLYRETFPVGLRDAKVAIEQVEAGLPVPIPDTSWEAEGDLPLAAAEEITKLVAVGQMAAAARLYRITFDTSHVEAETAVEALQAGKSIDVARRSAKREVQSTAVRREPDSSPTPGYSRSLVPLALVFLFIFLAVAAVLIVVLFVL